MSMPTERPESWSHRPQSVAGKAVVLTGGTTGIGRAAARLLVAQGAKVLIFGRHEKELNDALKDIGGDGDCFGITADQAREQDVERVFQTADDKLGQVDILINNAAVAGSDVASMDLDEVRYVVEANVVGYLSCARLAMERMQRRGGGHIVNIGSMSADVRSAGEGVYAATKAAIQGWSESMRKRVNEEGIKVTLIEPGAVGTDLPDATPEQQRQKQKEGAMLTAEDIAECVLYTLTQPARCDVVNVQIRPHEQTI